MISISVRSVLFSSIKLISVVLQVILGDVVMGYVFRCERCGKVIEEDARPEYVDALEQHFRDNHPNVDHSENMKRQYI